MGISVGVAVGDLVGAEVGDMLGTTEKDTFLVLVPKLLIE